MTTTQTHAALLSDEEVAQCINQSRTNLFDRSGTTSFRIARAIEQALLAKLQPALPSTPKQIRDFVGSHAISMEFANAKESDDFQAFQNASPSEDDKYYVSAHDLLSSFRDWAPEPAQEPAQAGELPDEREQFKRDMKTLGERHGWSFGEGLEWDEARQDWGVSDMYTNWMWWAWLEARAALAARKPLSEGQVDEQLHDGDWYWVSYTGLSKTYRAAALYKANVDCFYSFEFSGIPSREVQVHSFVGVGINGLEVKT